MLDLMYRIPSDESISRCVISKETVEENLRLEEEDSPAIEMKKEDNEELAS